MTPQSKMSRRHFLHSAALATGAVVLVACGAQAPAAPAQPTAAPPTTAPPTNAPPTAPVTATSATVDGLIPSPAPGVPDAYTKLPPLFKSVTTVLGKGGKVTTFQPSFFPPVPARNENKYWQELEKRLGASIEPTLAPSGPAYAEKLAALTASGDLPDLTFVDTTAVPDQKKVIQQGGYTDLTPYLTGNALKDYPNLAAFPPQIWKNVAIKAKIYGVPRPRFLASTVLLFRQDWAEKVGMPNPKNAEDFFNLMVAFTKNDPDGNGKADTYGLGSQAQETFDLSFFQSMYRVPNQWRLNSDGSLTYYIETDEFKQAIAYARRLFEAGIFYPDSVSLNVNQAKDGLRNSKYGGYVEGVGALPGTGNGMRFTAKQITPSAKVIGLVPFGWDGGKAITNNAPGYGGFVSIPVKAGKDPERVKELLRIVNYYAAAFGSEEQIFLNNGIEGVHHELKADGTRVKNDLGRKEIGDFPNLMNNPQVAYYDVPGDAVYIQGLIKDLLAIGVDNPVLTAFSATDAAKAGELNQLRIDRATAIISGREPLSALDTWIQDWRARGGDQIRKEYQDALKG